MSVIIPIFIFVFVTKVGREQPTTTAAMAAGEHSESDLTSGKYNHSPQAS